MKNLIFRYEVLGRDERRQVFDRFMKEWKRDSFNELKELLRESKNLGMITSKTPSSGKAYEHIHELLQKDKRYANLNPLKEDRDKAMKEFIENIGKAE